VKFVKLAGIVRSEPCCLAINGLKGCGSSTQNQKTRRSAGVQIGHQRSLTASPNGSMSGAEHPQETVCNSGSAESELRTQPVEAFLGRVRGNSSIPKKSECCHRIREVRARLRQWRKSVSMDRVSEFRKHTKTRECSSRSSRLDGNIQDDRR